MDKWVASVCVVSHHAASLFVLLMEQGNMKPVTGSQNFVSMASALRCSDEETHCTTSNADTELWLVQVPQEFDMSALNKLDSSMLGMSGGTQSLRVKTEREKKVYFSAAFKDSADCKRMSTVVTGSRGEISLGGKISNMLMVTETAVHSARHADSILMAPKKPVAMPAGLKARYTPFGTADKLVKEDTERSNKKRKREGSPPDEEPSPKKKKKKTKHWHSGFMELQNGDIRDIASCVVSSQSKLKSRKSEEAIGNSCVDGQIFVIHEINDPGEQGLENKEDMSDKNTKHKKVKKGRKYRNAT